MLGYIFLEAQLFNQIDVTDSLPSLTTSRLVFPTISPLFVDRFGRSSRFCYLEFEVSHFRWLEECLLHKSEMHTEFEIKLSCLQFSENCY